MKSAIIHRTAARRFAEIWDYTCEKWSEEQADHYLRNLGAFIQNLPNQRRSWRKVQDKRLFGVFCARCEHHFVFFREMDDHVAVISILHESMDIPTRLREDAQESP
jgi:toxin ParE1/3/4